MNPQEFGEYIRRLREEKGVSITELAKEAGISRPYLSQIESGSKGVPSIKVLKKLAGPLGIPYMELMYSAGLVNHLPAAVDFLSADIEIIKLWFPHIKEDVLHALEEKYKTYFGEDFKITLETLNSSIWEEPLKPGIANLIKELTEHIETIKSETHPPKLDLKDLLNSDILYNGHDLTVVDRNRILDMLAVLFPAYAKEKRDPK